MNNENIKGHIAAIASNIISGLNITFSKLLLNTWMTPMGYTVTRILFGCVIFWTISFFTGKEKVGRMDLLVIALGGLLGLVITQVGFAEGLRLITPVTWSLIAALIPVAVFLISALFLKESISLKKIIGIILGISGVALIILQNKRGSSASNNFLGILMAIGCVISCAVYMVIIRKTSMKYAPITITKWIFLYAVIVLLPFNANEFSRQRLYSSEASLIPIIQLGFSVLFSGILAVFLAPVALKRIKASTASVYTNLQPIAASASAIIAGQDIFSWDKLLALILVIVGVYIVTRTEGRSTTSP
jgi:drug/metabolite transporter (DMT)-like permease